MSVQSSTVMKHHLCVTRVVHLKSIGQCVAVKELVVFPCPGVTAVGLGFFKRQTHSYHCILPVNVRVVAADDLVGQDVSIRSSLGGEAKSRGGLVRLRSRPAWDRRCRGPVFDVFEARDFVPPFALVGVGESVFVGAAVLGVLFAWVVVHVRGVRQAVALDVARLSWALWFRLGCT